MEENPLRNQIPCLQNRAHFGKDIMPDLLHPNKKGYEIWAKAIAPTVEEIMGAVPKTHTANAPEPRDHGHHRNDVAQKNAMGQVDFIMIGDSITHAWDGPKQKEVWQKYYGKRKAINMGLGGDATQHALWRMQNGPLDGISPKLVVLMMGINNLWYQLPPGRKCTPAQTVDGLEAILDAVHKRCPNSHILHLAVFPAMPKKGDLLRRRIAATNAALPALAKKKQAAWGGKITFMSINDKFLDKDGNLSKVFFPDYCHPSKEGCEAWAEAIEPVVEKYLGKRK